MEVKLTQSNEFRQCRQVRLLSVALIQTADDKSDAFVIVHVTTLSLRGYRFHPILAANLRLGHQSGALVSVACIRLVGCLTSTEQCQFEHLEETINITVPYFPQPLALHVDRSEDVLFLVWSMVKGLRNLLPSLVWIRFPVKSV